MTAPKSSSSSVGSPSWTGRVFTKSSTSSSPTKRKPSFQSGLFAAFPMPIPSQELYTNNETFYRLADQRTRKRKPTVVGSPVPAWNKKREPLVVCNMRPLRLSYAFSLLALLPLFPIQGQTPVVSAGNAALSAYPLRGDLVARPYRVGFRRLFRFDASRTWQTTRDFKGAFSPDLSGRPVQINVWYPAAATGRPRQMHFADYVNQTAPEAFSKFNTIVKDHNRRNAVDSVPRDQLPALQPTPMNAYLEAAPPED